MGRNKLIYVLSQATVIVKSDTKGGTWEGANENLKNKWVPTLVANSKTVKKNNGNSELVKRGAHWLPEDFNFSIEKIVDHKLMLDVEQGTLFNYDQNQKEDSPNLVRESEVKMEPQKLEKQSHTKHILLNYKEAALFDIFIIKLWQIFLEKDINKNDIIEKFELTPKQVDVWLKRAIKEEFIIKKSNPVHYILNPGVIVSVN